MTAREPLPEARRADPRDRSRAGHDRRHRARHRFRAGLPRLAALPRPAHPVPRRHQGLDRVDPSHGRGRSSGSRSSGSPLLAVLDHRDRRSILWPSFAAVGLVGFQAWLGRETVRLGNSGESVTAHLAAALALVGLLVFLTVRAGYPARIGGRGASQRFTLLAAFTTAATFALLLFGSHVTATASALVFPDWPLMNGTLLPALTDATSAHVLHRWVAAVVGRHRRGARGRRLADPARPPDARPARGRVGGPVRDPGRRSVAPRS